MSRNGYPNTSLALMLSENFLKDRNLEDDKKLLDELYKLTLEATNSAPAFASDDVRVALADEAIDEFAKSARFAQFKHVQYLKRQVAEEKANLQAAEERLDYYSSKLHD